MIYKEREVDKNDIYTLYNFYWSYKEYYNFYWQHNGTNNVTKDDIDLEIKNVIESKRPLEGPIEALCFYANVSKSDFFNKDGTPKDINYIDVLEKIKENNYGKTND